MDWVTPNSLSLLTVACHPPQDRQQYVDRRRRLNLNNRIRLIRQQPRQARDFHGQPLIFSGDGATDRFSGSLCGSVFDQFLARMIERFRRRL